MITACKGRRMPEYAYEMSVSTLFMMAMHYKITEGNCTSLDGCNCDLNTGKVVKDMVQSYCW